MQLGHETGSFGLVDGRSARDATRNHARLDTCWVRMRLEASVSARLAVSRKRRVPLAVGVVLLGSLSVLAAVPGSAAGPTSCSATGGDTTSDETIGGVKYIVVTFLADGTFTPSQTMDVEYLIVAGGGGGSRGNQNLGGGGGGAGGVQVNVGSPLQVSAPSGVVVGAGGTAKGNATVANNGHDSSAFGVTATGGGGGNGGASGVPAGSGGSGGGGGSAGGNTASGSGSGGQGNDGGDGRSATQDAGGGGGGFTSAGAAAADGTGGTGGDGLTTSDFGGTVSVAGGGGGSSKTTGAAGGSGGGGAGGNDPAANRAGENAVPNTGGGGGAGYRAAGGDGGSGIVKVRFRKYCQNPSSPQSVGFSAPTLSWSAPSFVPSALPLTSYTVTYTDSANSTSSGSIYARGSTATTINITGATPAACASNNPGWTCAMTGGDLVSGHTYEFQVFARTASTFGALSSAVPYVAP